MTTSSGQDSQSLMTTGDTVAHTAFSNMQAKTANPSLVGWVTGASFRVAKGMELVAGEYSRLRSGRQGGTRWPAGLVNSCSWLISGISKFQQSGDKLAHDRMR